MNAHHGFNREAKFMSESYQNFHLQLLAGEWRESHGDESRAVENPCSGDTLMPIRSANVETGSALIASVHGWSGVVDGVGAGLPGSQ